MLSTQASMSNRFHVLQFRSRFLSTVVKITNLNRQHQDQILSYNFMTFPSTRASDSQARIIRLSYGGLQVRHHHRHVPSVRLLVSDRYAYSQQTNWSTNVWASTIGWSTFAARCGAEMWTSKLRPRRHLARSFRGATRIQPTFHM